VANSRSTVFKGFWPILKQFVTSFLPNRALPHDCPRGAPPGQAVHLWFAITLADCKINNIAAMLPPLFWYNSCPCFDSLSCAWECWFASCGASEPPPRKSHAMSTTCRAEASASEAKNRPARQALLGRRTSGLVRMETIVDRGYTRDCGQVAPGRFPLVLAADLQGQDAGGEKTGVEGSSGFDLPDGR
jgi:hypothetical protein